MDAKAYAIHRKVSGAMITKYLKNGMIPSAKQIGRKWYIDPQKADIELDAALGRTEKIVSKIPTKEYIDQSQKTPMPSLAANRAIKEMYAARLQKLEFEEKSKKLVPYDELKLKLSKLHLQVRDNLRTIPDRISPIVAAETDPSKIHSLITTEIRECLEGLKTIDIS
tara:strand:+ start:46 stop:546 length:501 start_codon:yes stop_codon:yes gene_type:complete